MNPVEQTFPFITPTQQTAITSAFVTHSSGPIITFPVSQPFSGNVESPLPIFNYPYNNSERGD